MYTSRHWILNALERALNLIIVVLLVMSLVTGNAKADTAIDPIEYAIDNRECLILQHRERTLEAGPWPAFMSANRSSMRVCCTKLGIYMGNVAFIGRLAAFDATDSVFCGIAFVLWLIRKATAFDARRCGSKRRTWEFQSLMTLFTEASLTAADIVGIAASGMPVLAGGSLDAMLCAIGSAMWLICEAKLIGMFGRVGWASCVRRPIAFHLPHILSTR